MAIAKRSHFPNSNPGLLCLCVLNVPVPYVNVPCVQIYSVFVMYMTIQYVCSICVNELCVCGVNTLCPCPEYSILSSLPGRKSCSSAEVSHAKPFWPPRLDCGLGTCAYLSGQRFPIDDIIWIEKK